MVELRTHEGIPGAPLREQWTRLVERDPDATIFHTPRYLTTWLDELGEGTDPVVRTLHAAGGELVGVVAEGHEPAEDGRRISFLGGTRVTDYQGPVGEPELREEIADAYMGALAGDRRWSQLVAGGLAADSGWVEQLVKHAERHGLYVAERRQEDVCPRIDLTGGYEAYLERLPAKRRHEQLRKARKLARDVGPVELVSVPPEQTAERLDVFLEMAAGSGEEVPEDDGPRAAKTRFFSKEEMRSFFVALADRLAPDGSLRLHLLDVVGSPAAAAVSLQWDGQWALYNTAFDEMLASLAPGMVLIGQLLQQAAEQGFEVFDLLRGDEPYKYRFGATDRGVGRLTITPGAAA